MRIVFMGSPAEVLGPLKALFEEHQRQHLNLVAIVSQPARPKGRGQNLIDPPVASFAKEQNIPVLQPLRASAPDFLNDFRALSPDLVVTAAYGQILSEEFLSIPRCGTINIHPSLLPEYRGATPVAAALLDGRRQTGVSILFTVKKLDAGNIILQEPHNISDGATTGALTQTLFDQSVPLLIKAIDLCKDPLYTGTAQDNERVTHCRKINKEDGKVNWHEPAAIIVQKYQAYSPWPGLYCHLEDQRINLFDLSLTETTLALRPGGCWFDKKDRTLLISTGKGAITVRQLQRAGGKVVQASDFWNSLKNRTEAQFT